MWVQRNDIMKARLLPVYFPGGRDEEFDRQVARLRNLFNEQAEILKPVALGSSLPETDAVVFPQILGEAYNQLAAFKTINSPILVITSEFGTVSMWDWEITGFLTEEGVETIAPCDLEQAKRACRALAIKREMQGAKFLVYQDNPGEGFQPGIFKRFFWWQDRCARLIKERFGITIEKRSFRTFGEEAKQISDDEAATALQNIRPAAEGLPKKALLSAVKIYLAAKRELEKDPSIRGIGINCLNESHFSDTTPCLAWSRIYEETGVLWACEADTVSLLTKYILDKPLGAPIMMTNIYPFLMGMAALKHERISHFPEVDDPDNHVLMAHCGYFGLLPEQSAAEWTLRPKVLGIVDKNAHVIDARLPVGNVTLVKLGPGLNKVMVIEGMLETYVQYQDSDCRNGAVIRVPDGHRLMNDLYSHHQCVLAGHWGSDIEMVARIFSLQVQWG